MAYSSFIIYDGVDTDDDDGGGGWVSSSEITDPF